FEFFGDSDLVLFFERLFRDFFFFLGGFFPLFFQLLDRFADRVETAVLTFVGGGPVDRGEVPVAVAAGGPRDRRVEDRFGVAVDGVVGVDVGVIAAEAGFVAFQRAVDVVRAVPLFSAFLEAHGHTGGREHVEDAFHARRQRVAGNEQLQLGAQLLVCQTGDRVGFAGGIAF